MKTYFFSLFLLTAFTAWGQVPSTSPRGAGAESGFATQTGPTPQSPITGSAVQTTNGSAQNQFSTNQLEFGRNAGLLSTGPLAGFGVVGTPAGGGNVEAVIANLRLQIEQALPVLAAATASHAGLQTSGTATSVISRAESPIQSARAGALGGPIAGGSSPASISPGMPASGIGEPMTSPGPPSLTPGQPMGGSVDVVESDSAMPGSTATAPLLTSDPQALQWLVVLQNDLQRLLPVLQALDATRISMDSNQTNSSSQQVTTPSIYTNDFGIRIDNTRMPTLRDPPLTPTGR